MNFSIPVASNLYLKNDYKEAIWDEILASKVYETKKYRYSDLGFYMLSELVHRISRQRLDDFIETQFYERLGLQTMTYNPLTKFDHNQIVPTEEDRYFRRQKVQGFVHDMGAAMLGGVSGHAGLFSNTNDLAIVFQMLLNEGYYAGIQYLSPETIRKFTTRCDACTRRGIGFDMKQTNRRKNQNLPDAASINTFGHIGFTGTCVWADPDNDLIFIFLSNRTYPSMSNDKLIDENVRGRIHEVVYEALQ